MNGTVGRLDWLADIKAANFNLPSPGMFTSLDFEQLTAFARENQANLLLFAAFVFIAVRQYRSNAAKAKANEADLSYLPAPGFPEVERLIGFDHRKQEPLKLRLFKPKYHLTMAIQNLEPSELVLIDNTYAERLEYRKRVIAGHSDIVIGVDDDKRAGPAVREMYTYLFTHYLPKRYPGLFKLHHTTYENGSQFMLQNLETKQVFPAKPSSSTSTKQLLHILGVTIDEDFLFLMPEDAAEGKETDAKYKLEAYVCICPSGWDPRTKLGKRLAAIHGPVPGYNEKLEASMDKYFSKMEVGKYVKRSNWAISEHEDLFLTDESTNHGKEGDEVKEAAEVDPDKTFLRCERQTLHKLPCSKAAVFAFHTYLEPISAIKEEGIGSQLADAVEGLKTGGTPAMHLYKRGPVWGKAVAAYLRS